MTWTRMAVSCSCVRENNNTKSKLKKRKEISWSCRFLYYTKWRVETGQRLISAPAIGFKLLPCVQWRSERQWWDDDRSRHHIPLLFLYTNWPFVIIVCIYRKRYNRDASTAYESNPPAEIVQTAHISFNNFFVLFPIYCKGGSLLLWAIMWAVRIKKQIHYRHV